jgi:hypothetical protein
MKCLRFLQNVQNEHHLLAKLQSTGRWIILPDCVSRFSSSRLHRTAQSLLRTKPSCCDSSHHLNMLSPYLNWFRNSGHSHQ